MEPDTLGVLARPGRWLLGRQVTLTSPSLSQASVHRGSKQGTGGRRVARAPGTCWHSHSHAHLWPPGPGSDLNPHTRPSPQAGNQLRQPPHCLHPWAQTGQTAPGPGGGDWVEAPTLHRPWAPGGPWPCMSRWSRGRGLSRGASAADLPGKVSREQEEVWARREAGARRHSQVRPWPAPGSTTPTGSPVSLEQHAPRNWTGTGGDCGEDGGGRGADALHPRWQWAGEGWRSRLLLAGKERRRGLWATAPPWPPWEEKG